MIPRPHRDTRVAIISDLWVPFPGGAERYLFNVSRHLKRRGHDIRVLTGYHARQLFDGPPVDCLELQTRDRIEEGEAMLSKWVEIHDPEVAIVHQHWGYEFGPLIANNGIPVVQMVYNGARIPNAALAVYISEFTRRNDRSARTSDLTLLPWAEDDVVCHDETRGSMIGFVKPLEHKGARFLYNLAAAMPDQQFLVLRGEWQPLEITEDLPNVTYMEPVDDMRDFWQRVAVVLVPSLSEDAGTVAQEATANGVVCISSNVGGLPETNAGGVRMKRHDIDEWAQVVRRITDGSSLLRDTWLRSQRQYTPRPDKGLAELDRRIQILADAR